MFADPIATLISLLRERHPGIHGVYLFGSRSTDSARQDSDWDIGVLGSRISLSDLRSTAACAANMLGAQADLVDLRKASPVLKAEVLRHGRLIFASDSAEIARFEMETLTEYQNLNENRRNILGDFGMAA
jgi:predicted nucleotidyltransferase